ncbi:hypothetical protein J5N97_025905 [Dioscorea zingiberensis]|uniref:Protein kinase domain-containing protein n=1 Tax=Dioscorea zingiberensis TaxID=325984 RepID=A0A9D5C282_9LILI|nr:hypothetical protein J5N97_025905 [Dioscorea zingiberensis]
MATVTITTLLLTLTYSFLTPKSSSLTSEQEKKTLLQIKNLWGNPPSLQSWQDNDGSNNDKSSTTHCKWTGIYCSSDGFITNISLPNQNIYGPFPHSLCNLTNLTHINLFNNYISGQFPVSLYECSKLQFLHLGANFLVGIIPSDINRMSPSLNYLDLSDNKFTGNIPPNIGLLPSIQSLFLNDNHFNGSFPVELSQLSTLQTLSLAYNPFAPATLHAELGQLSALQTLWMGNTSLIGQIPTSFANLSALRQLDLSMNMLTGTIPVSIWSLSNLQNLYLYANHLSGEINGTIGAVNLTDLDISMNKLSGPIPEDLGKLKNMRGLAMYDNNFSGEIPASIGLLPMLADIRLFGNNLTGVLPPELGWHSKLLSFDVMDNRISGELPAGLCAGRVLTSVVASNNNFTGRLPESLGDCPTLDNIQVYNNRLTGEVPAGIWSAVNLTTVMIHDNRFSGKLPEKIPWKISRLEIANNRFSGPIPTTAVNLQVFQAANNQFSGEIPADLDGFSRLEVLSLAGNRIYGRIPGSISAMRNLNTLNLSNNRLFGEISAGIGSLPVLTNLDLSGNELTGEIPEAMAELKLNFLNLSSNQLSGEVPTPIQNRAYEHSFLANPGLCSPSPILHLRACDRQSDRRDHISVALILFFVFLGLGLLGTALLTITQVRYFKRSMDSVDSTTWTMTLFQPLDFNEARILEGLTERNLIGSGGGGQVYKIVLGDRAGETVAVKKIWNSRKLDSKLEKEFQAEVRILGSIRHANIVKLICCISNVDSKLLVYEYMENESLDRKVNEKVDVFSFGVVLLELTTGRMAHDGKDYSSLAEWAWRHVQEEQLIDDAIDKEIRDPAYMQEIEMVFKLGLICTSPESSRRPTMKKVLQFLLHNNPTIIVGNRFDDEHDVATLLQTKRGSRHKSVSDSDQFDDSCTSPV